MPHYGDGKATAESIRNRTRNTLQTAEALGAESLVIPALGCGVAGFDLQAGVEIICEAIDEHDPDGLTDVRIIGYSEREVETMQEIAEAVRDGT